MKLTTNDELQLNSLVGTGTRTLQVSAGGTISAATKNYSYKYTASTTAVTTTTGLMVGLGYGFSASTTGIAFVNINFTNVGSGSNQTFTVLLRWGTGSTPINGGALTGTIAATMTWKSPASAVNAPVGISSIINIGTSATPTWFDLSLAATSGTSQAINVNGSFIEI
jgi:hypothetical protein